MHKYSQDETLRSDADALFIIVGGISVMTLLINGMTSGPLLSAVRTNLFSKLGTSLRKLTFPFYPQLNLAAKEKTRHKVVENYMRQMIQVRF